jgi:hypothetical protein
MFDELERLGESENLFALLTHYARAGAADREAWQGRLGQLNGARAEDVVRLHGELIAYDWAEQNTGEVPVCYRLTPAGLRAFRHAMARRPAKDEAA